MFPLPSEAYDPGGRPVADKRPAPAVCPAAWRAFAPAAALTSMSLRDLCRVPGLGTILLLPETSKKKKIRKLVDNE